MWRTAGRGGHRSAHRSDGAEGVFGYAEATSAGTALIVAPDRIIVEYDKRSRGAPNQGLERCGPLVLRILPGLAARSELYPCPHQPQLLTGQLSRSLSKNGGPNAMRLTGACCFGARPC